MRSFGLKILCSKKGGKQSLKLASVGGGEKETMIAQPLI
jgi:hypothetical protein